LSQQAQKVPKMSGGGRSANVNERKKYEEGRLVYQTKYRKN
jgi:hypothetical protein